MTIPASRSNRVRGGLAAAGRLAATVLATLLGLAALTFVIGRVMPIDPVTAVVGAEADQQTIDAMRERLGLDKPLYVQFGSTPRRVARRFRHGDHDRPPGDRRHPAGLARDGGARHAGPGRRGAARRSARRGRRRLPGPARRPPRAAIRARGPFHADLLARPDRARRLLREAALGRRLGARVARLRGHGARRDRHAAGRQPPRRRQGGVPRRAPPHRRCRRSILATARSPTSAA